MTAKAQSELTQLNEAPSLTPKEQRDAKVKSLIKRYAAISAGLGFIPVPVIDVATISAAQYSMIRDIAEVYGYESSKERARVIVSSILGGGLPTLISFAGGGSLVKAIPFVGSIAGAIFVPTMASAVTIALGRVFSRHFEAGGTMLDLNAETLRSHFKAELESAKLK